MNELGSHLSDVLRLTLGITVGALYWIVRPSAILKAKILGERIDVTRKHTLSLEELLMQAKRNYLIFQAYFIDLNLISAARLVGILLLLLAWIFLSAWLCGLSISGSFVFLVVVVADLFLVLSMLVLIHRRERVKDL